MLLQARNIPNKHSWIGPASHLSMTLVRRASIEVMVFGLEPSMAYFHVLIKDCVLPSSLIGLCARKGYAYCRLQVASKVRLLGCRI